VPGVQNLDAKDAPKTCTPLYLPIRLELVKIVHG
jgi:hypothetical protein